MGQQRCFKYPSLSLEASPFLSELERIIASPKKTTLNNKQMQGFNFPNMQALQQMMRMQQTVPQ